MKVRGTTVNYRWSVIIVLAAFGGWLAGITPNSTAKSNEVRFPQLTVAQLNDQQRPLAEYILKFSRVGIGGPYNAMLRSPGAAKPMLDLLDYLRFHTTVPTRLNEFAILIQGRMWRSQVEWFAHYPAAIKAGVSEKVLAELKANKRPGDMMPDEAAVYDFCTALYTKHEVSDAIYDRLRQFLNDQQIVELTMVSGTYVSVASLLAMAEQGPPAGEALPFQPGDR
jgi:4-carboxymuconolactone decarboxylase